MSTEKLEKSLLTRTRYVLCSTQQQERNMSEIDGIKRKVFGLLQKTVEANCTKEEALGACEAAGKLMDQYNLTMSDIQIRQQKCVQVNVKIPGTKGGKAGPMKFCTISLARYCDVKIWWGRGRRSYVNTAGNYVIFGLEQDTELFLYLYEVILNAMRREKKDFKKSTHYKECQGVGFAKRATANFYKGMALQIADRLDAIKINRRREVETTGRDLVLLKSQMIDDEFQSTGIKLSTRYQRDKRVDMGARNLGRDAGDRVNLNGAINGTTAARVLT